MPGLKEYLNQPVSKWAIVPALVLGTAVIALSASGHGEAAVAVPATVWLLGLIQRISQRRTRALSGSANNTKPVALEPLRLQEAAKLSVPPEAVWALIHPAENAPLLNPETARGYRVPGTPDGVGEQQAFVALDGTTTVIEVIESAPGRRAVIRQVSPVPEVPCRLAWSMEPTSDGTILSYSLFLDPPPGLSVPADWREQYVAQWRADAQDYLSRVAACLADQDTQKSASPNLTD